MCKFIFEKILYNKKQYVNKIALLAPESSRVSQSVKDIGLRERQEWRFHAHSRRTHTRQCGMIVHSYGQRDGHLTRQEVEELFTSMHTNMTSLAQEKKQIGNTTLGIEMFVYTLQARDNLGPEAPALLITSLFHAREVATL